MCGEKEMKSFYTIYTVLLLGIESENCQQFDIIDITHHWQHQRHWCQLHIIKIQDNK